MNIMYLLISLVLTSVVYGLFPLLFSRLRKKPITARRYRIISFIANIVGVWFFIFLNGSGGGAPYVIWTLLFTKLGIEKLDERGVLIR